MYSNFNLLELKLKSVNRLSLSLIHRAKTRVILDSQFQDSWHL
jgi:hypothetical protein